MCAVFLYSLYVRNVLYSLEGECTIELIVFSRLQRHASFKVHTKNAERYRKKLMEQV